MPPKKKKPKLSPDELRARREAASFSRRIRTTFTNAGFTYIPTGGIHRKFGNKEGELDAAFVYKNIILICEDTIATSKIKDHLKNKSILAREIQSNAVETVAWMKSAFPDRFSTQEVYDDSRFKVFYLYFSKYAIDLTDDDHALVAPVRVVETSTLNYLHKMAQNIKFSSRADVFRYLQLDASDIGLPKSGTSLNSIEASIIYPVDSTGLKGGVRLVSFMMKAEDLMRNSFVLRKDSWEQSTPVYQRLIEKDRIQSIRKYLASHSEAFLNNIIVSLPKGITFQDADGETVPLKEIDKFTGYKMLIPDHLNSICIIDGQHRVFAHYEGNDALEAIVAPLRQKVHLLVTGLVFPPAMAASKRMGIESQVFLDINSNAKKVPADVILYIETVKDPYSDVGVSRQVLERLNKKGVFKGKFQLSLLVEAPIKTASIIRFALRYLVEITADEDRDSLYLLWSKENPARQKLATEKDDDALLSEYVTWVSNLLEQYFSAVRSANKEAWDDPTSRILSTTAINGYLIALRRSWKSVGTGDITFYKKRFEKVATNFAKESFEYSSSQYGKFSRVILEEAFRIAPDAEEAK